MDNSLRDLFDRYGPTLAVVLTLVMLVVLLPSNAKKSPKAALQAGQTSGSATRQNTPK